MDEIAMLEKRQDEFDGRLRHTEIALERNNVLTERNTKVSEQFAATLEAIKDTMVQISTATTENGKTVADLTRNVGALTTKINEVDKKVDALSGKLVDIFAKLNVDKAKFKDLGITFEEKAFYDILVDLRDSRKFEYPNDRCIELAKQIKTLIDKTAVHADWLNNTNLKKKLAYDLMKLLYKNGYPPQWNQEIFDKVLDQVEHFRTYN